LLSRRNEPAIGTMSSISNNSQQTVVDYSLLSVRDLKRLLNEAGISGSGATEKTELVRLLRRANAHKSLAKFEASSAWQLVTPGTALPPGLEVRFDLETGQNFARCLPSPLRCELARVPSTQRTSKSESTCGFANDPNPARIADRMPRAGPGLLSIADATRALGVLDSVVCAGQIRRRVTGKTKVVVTSKFSKASKTESATRCQLVVSPPKQKPV